MESAARELRGILIQELKELEKAKTVDELHTQVSEISIMMAKRMREAIVDDIDFAYRNGYESAYGEIKGINKTAAKAPDMSVDDEDLLRVLKNEGALFKAYADFQSAVTEQLNRIITQSVAAGLSIPQTVQAMRAGAIGETYKLTRIARTEITNISNEGRLRGYKIAEQRMGRQFKYGLIVGKDSRVCPAHQELSRRQPSGGMYLDDLIMLQQEVGSKYRMNLRGHSLLHPNQRTSLVRIV
jgi:hypothetical protein